MAGRALLLLLLLTITPVWADGMGRRVEKGSTAPIPLGASFSSTDLARVTIGNQAGILKVVGHDREVLFIKDAPNVSMQGIDGTMWAPVSDKHREAIFKALSIGDEELDRVSRAIMQHFEKLRRHEAVVLLGVLGSVPDARLSEETGREIQVFLAKRLQERSDVRMRRLAVLSLALDDETDYEVVDSVVDLLEESTNAWETFTTQQFFEYHRGYVRSCPQAAKLCERVESSGNPYAPQILTLIR